MFDEGVGDYFSTNYDCRPPLYDHWGCRYGYTQPWHCHHRPYNNWMWNYGYNNYDFEREAGCFTYPSNNASTETEQKNHYRTYERNLGGSNSPHNVSERSSAGDALWKTIKIDCFSAHMDMSRTHSELTNTSSATTIGRVRATLPRRNRKHKLSRETRSFTNMRQQLNKLDKKVALNESILAFVLLKLNSKKDDEQRCAGGGADTPYAYYSSEKMQNLENEILEKLKHQVESSESGTAALSVDKKFIKDWHKLYNDLGGGLRYDTQPKCTRKPLVEDIQNEFAHNKSKGNVEKQEKHAKHTNLKNNNNKPVVAKVTKTKAKVPSKAKEVKVDEPAMKTKELGKENKNKSKQNSKPTNTVKVKAPSALLHKIPLFSNIANKSSKKFLPQEVAKSSIKRTKNFMPSSHKKYKIYLDKCVYSVDPKRL